MPARDWERIIEILVEIQSDIRSMRRDINSLLAKSSAASSEDSSGEQAQPFVESIEPPDPNVNEQIIRYLREKPGNDEIGSD
jgi:hypothetical protein